MVHFDWTISIGNVIELGAILTAAFSIYNKIDRRIAALEFKVGLIWSRLYPGFVLEEHVNHGQV